MGFSAAKLMMPPVLRRVEPVATKKPVISSLDIHKLQEEKEALLRQRASAVAAPSSASVGIEPAADDDGAISAMQPAGGSTSSLLHWDPDEEYDPAKPNDYEEAVRRRMRLKAEEEMERRRHQTHSRLEADLAPEPKPDEPATKMMKDMGWKEGSGLGKDAQGMATPLVMKKTDA